MLGIRIARHQLLILGLLCLLTRSALGQAPVSITVLPNTVTAGAGSTGIVALSAPAKSAVTLALTCNTSGVTLPASVTVGEGKQSTLFTLSTQASDKTAIVTLTASGGGGSAVGFFMVQASATTPLPGYAGLTFSPTMALSGQKITGTIAFTEPLVVPITFDLTSQSANFTVPPHVTAKAGEKSVPFSVKAGAEATTDVAQVTATLAPGSYTNAWTGPLYTSGNLVFLADTGLPLHYAAGFWVAAPVILGSTNSFFVATLKTYPDGSFCLGGSGFDYDGTDVGYFDYGPYIYTGRIGYNGQINLGSNDYYPFGSFIPFPENGFGSTGSAPTPSYLYDNSTLTFSSDGKTATLNVIAQEYTWTLSTTPTTIFGNIVNLGTYTFTRVQ